MSKEIAVTAYMPIDPDMTWRGSPIEIGQTYKIDHERTSTGENNLYACVLPFNCWLMSLYFPSPRLFAKVTLIYRLKTTEPGSEGKINLHSEVTFDERLELSAWIEEQVRSIVNLSEREEGCVLALGDGKHVATTGLNSPVIINGQGSHGATNGPISPVFVSGSRNIAATRNCNSPAIAVSKLSVVITIGPDSAAVATSEHSHTITEGPNAPAITTEKNSFSETEGPNAPAIATGPNSVAVAKGPNSIAAALGSSGTAMTGEGGGIVCVERDNDGNIKFIIGGTVGEDGIKPHTPYQAINGELVEVTP